MIGLLIQPKQERSSIRHLSMEWLERDGRILEQTGIPCKHMPDYHPLINNLSERQWTEWLELVLILEILHLLKNYSKYELNWIELNWIELIVLYIEILESTSWYSREFQTTLWIWAFHQSFYVSWIYYFRLWFCYYRCYGSSSCFGSPT